MAAKRDKPALYELMSKSTTTTPAWFYGPRKAESGGSPASEATQTHIKKPSLLGMAGQALPGKALVENRLRFALPYWVLALIVLGLILALLVAFRMGQKQLASNAPTTADSQSNYAATETETDNELQLATTEPENNSARTLAENEFETAVVAGPAIINRGNTNTTAPAVNAGQCYVLYSDSNRNYVKLAQKYFNDNGLNTVIGSFQGRFVLATQQKFGSSKSADAIKLKNKIAALGEIYNEKRPAGAPIITPKTFRQAYIVRASRIE